MLEVGGSGLVSVVSVQRLRVSMVVSLLYKLETTGIVPAVMAALMKSVQTSIGTSLDQTGGSPSIRFYRSRYRLRLRSGRAMIKIVVIALHAIDRHTLKYRKIRAHVRKEGTVAIRSVWSDRFECYLAIEGSHRLQACKDLDITPIMHTIEWSEMVEHDLQDFPSPCKVEMFRRYLEDEEHIFKADTRFEFSLGAS